MPVSAHSSCLLLAGYEVAFGCKLQNACSMTDVVDPFAKYVLTQHIHPVEHLEVVLAHCQVVDGDHLVHTCL